MVVAPTTFENAEHFYRNITHPSHNGKPAPLDATTPRAFHILDSMII